MSAKDDGGPAFPQEIPAGGGCGPINYFGMSLRDYFAAAGLSQAYSIAYDARNKTPDFDDITKAAYFLADVMLAERSK